MIPTPTTFWFLEYATALALALVVAAYGVSRAIQARAVLAGLGLGVFGLLVSDAYWRTAGAAGVAGVLLLVLVRRAK
ncbi:hypothetical protein [Streptomyces fuscigenes]|uniref:hypothetical protein n=1 Tax=Streptomyces fuscigenes TaxID=1528880 RepID=UPI001F276383|nr:hypothetical protein [Streptomyces fuscigenes]MCF3960306.1 hypothetical protein [Streptomyces fuscigenes]